MLSSSWCKYHNARVCSSICGVPVKSTFELVFELKKDINGKKETTTTMHIKAYCRLTWDARHKAFSRLERGQAEL